MILINKQSNEIYNICRLKDIFASYQSQNFYHQTLHTNQSSSCMDEALDFATILKTLQTLSSEIKIPV